MKPRLCFFGEGSVSDQIRLDMTGAMLEERGYEIARDIQRTGNEYDLGKGFDIAIFGRPHNADLVWQVVETGATVIIDQDDDFWSIPKDHVGYNYIGPGNPKSLKRIEECLAHADVITSPNKILLEKMEHFNPEAQLEFIPNGWNPDNPMWHLPNSKWYGDYVTIGWAGTITHRSDFERYKRPILKILEQYENTRIFIGQDPQIYQYFSGIPEDRKLFMPPLPYGLYPLIFQYIDIWIAPLLDNDFNRSKSDIKLVDAGAASKPWIASCLPAYREWREGGIIASNQEEWTDALDALVKFPDARIKLGMAGHEKAQTRTQDKIVDMWERIFDQL